jgi:hypothetical protein
MFIIDFFTPSRQFLEYYLAFLLKAFQRPIKNLPDIQGCNSIADKSAIRNEIISTTRYSNS